MKGYKEVTFSQKLFSILSQKTNNNNISVETNFKKNLCII